MSVVKSILCLGFFLFLWTSPFFRTKCIGLANIIEQFLAKNKNAVLFTVLGLYVVITSLLQLHHSVDGDEGQAWLIARDSKSLGQMYSLMGYEGTPGLWHTILRPFAKWGVSFDSIYFLNYFFVIAAIATWLWFSPFPLFTRLLLPFSHIFLTEYSINARSYALSVCLLFAGLTLYKRFYNKWILWASAFFLLANTNIHSTLLCCGFAVFLFLNWLVRKNRVDGKAMLLVGAGILLAVVQVYPPKDLEYGLAAFKLQTVPRLITVSVATGTATLSIVIYAAFLLQVMIAIKNRLLLATLIAIQSALLFLFLYKYAGEMRHHFYLFLSIIMCVWINNLNIRIKPVVHLFISAMLCMMIAASVPIAIKKWEQWSNYKEKMRDYVSQKIRDTPSTFVACHPDNIACTMLTNIPGTTFYMPDANRWGTYVIWNQERKSGLFNPNIARNVADLSRIHKNYRQYLYLTTQKLPEDSARYYHITLLKQTSNHYLERLSNQWGTYYLYKIPDEKEEVK